MAGAKRTAKKKTTDTTGRIYQMKITLLGVEPGAWRRFAVQADIGLAKLHDVIQIVMGWENYHLHQFITKDRRSYLPASDEFDLNPDEADESKFRLCDLLKRARARMFYEYDFGDGWAHELVLEKIVPPEQGVRYPVCLAGVSVGRTRLSPRRLRRSVGVRESAAGCRRPRSRGPRRRAGVAWGRLRP